MAFMQRVNYFKKISTLLILLTLLCTQVAFTKVDLPVVPMAMLKLGSSLQSAIIFEKSKGDYFAVTTSLDKVNLASKTIYLYRNGEKVGSESIKLVANDQIRNFSLWKLKKAVRLDKRYKLVTRQKIYDGLDKSHSVGFWSSFIENGKSLTEITDGVVQFFNFKGHNALPGFNSSLVFIGAEGGMEGSAVTIKQKNGDYQIAGMISGYSERFNSKSNLHYFINRGAAIPFPQLWGAIKATINDYQQNPSHVSSGCFYASDVMSDLVELDTNFSMKELFCWQDQVRLSLKTSTLSFQGIEFRLINSNNYNVIEQDSAIYRCQLKAESKHLNLGSGLEIARAGGGPDVAGAGGGPDVAGAGGGPDVAGAGGGDQIGGLSQSFSGNKEKWSKVLINQSATFIGPQDQVGMVRIRPTILGRNLVALKSTETVRQSGIVEISSITYLNYQNNVLPRSYRKFNKVNSLKTFVEILQNIIVTGAKIDEITSEVNPKLFCYGKQAVNTKDLSAKIRALQNEMFEDFNVYVKIEVGSRTDQKKILKKLKLIGNTLDLIGGDDFQDWQLKQSIFEIVISEASVPGEGENIFRVNKENNRLFFWVNRDHKLQDRAENMATILIMMKGEK